MNGDEWEVNGFRIRKYKRDHPPEHVHVYKGDKALGRYDLEHDCWMDTPASHLNTASEAIGKWRKDHGL